MESIPEIWKPVVGFEFLYFVSNRGRIRGVKSGKVLCLGTYPNGYTKITLYNGRREKTDAVHRVVMAAFHGPCPSGYQVNHRDGQRANNTLDNLEYVTPRQNIRHAITEGLCQKSFIGRQRSRLTANDIREMHALREVGWTYRQLGESFGICKQAVWNIIHCRTWKEYGDAMAE